MAPATLLPNALGQGLRSGNLCSLKIKMEQSRPHWVWVWRREGVGGRNGDIYEPIIGGHGFLLLGIHPPEGIFAGKTFPYDLYQNIFARKFAEFTEVNIGYK